MGDIVKKSRASIFLSEFVLFRFHVTLPQTNPINLKSLYNFKKYSKLFRLMTSGVWVLSVGVSSHDFRCRGFVPRGFVRQGYVLSGFWVSVFCPITMDTDTIFEFEIPAELFSPLLPADPRLLVLCQQLNTVLDMISPSLPMYTCFRRRQ